MSSSSSSINKMSLLVSLCVFFLISGVLSQDASPTTSPPPTTMMPTATRWSGCVDPVNGYRLVTIGEPITICLVLGNTFDWSTEMSYMRLNFQPIADQYSRFHVPQSYTQLIGNPPPPIANTFPTNITVHVESQTSLSYQKKFFDGSDHVYPYLTAIVDVDRGVVTGITWDNACLFCPSSACLPNLFDFVGNLATEEEAKQPVGACQVTTEECQTLASQEESVGCDLLLYVVWTGTDSNGRDFKSSAYRFSAFPAQSWTDRISQNLPAFVPQSTEDVQELNPLSNN